MLLERGVRAGAMGELRHNPVPGPGSCRQGEPWVLDRSPCTEDGHCQDTAGGWWDLSALHGVREVAESKTVSTQAVYRCL